MKLPTTITWMGAVVALLGLTACDPMGAAVVGTGLVASNAAVQRRSGTDFVDDNWVAWKIRTSYVDSEQVKLGNVNVSVYRGRVLLTGTAASEREVAEAIRIAKGVRGVTRVDSELKVQYEGAADLANDAFITNKVKFLLLNSTQVRGVDIHVETTKSVVYLTGMARTVAERDEAVRLTSTVTGVKEVVSYVEVNPEATPVEPYPPAAESQPVRRPGIAP